MEKVKECEEEMELEFKDCEGKREEEIAITDEIERSKIRIMRALVERETPSAKEVDDLMTGRFLRDCDLDIEKTSTMFLKHLRWRQTFVPNGYISESEIPTPLSHNEFYRQGVDKQRRPVIVLFGSRHKPGGKGSLEEFKRYCVYCLDKICARMPEGEKNNSINLAGLLPKEAWQIKRGSCALFIHDFMEGCNSLIESKTKKKIVFVKNKKLKSTLLCDIDECQLPDTHGSKTIFGYHAGLLSANLFPLVSP
ncbi:hypothetical protein SLE2022_049010 [Rubroshorea leprosula]